MKVDPGEENLAYGALRKIQMPNRWRWVPGKRLARRVDVTNLSSALHVGLDGAKAGDGRPKC